MPEPAHPPTIQVVLAEGDVFFTQALADAILATHGMQLQGRAGNLSADSADAGEPAAAVLVVDLGLPYGTDLDIIRAAQRQWLFAKKSTP